MARPRVGRKCKDLRGKLLLVKMSSRTQKSKIDTVTRLRARSNFTPLPPTLPLRSTFFGFRVTLFFSSHFQCILSPPHAPIGPLSDRVALKILEGVTQVHSVKLWAGRGSAKWSGYTRKVMICIDSHLAVKDVHAWGCWSPSWSKGYIRGYTKNDRPTGTCANSNQ